VRRNLDGPLALSAHAIEPERAEHRSQDQAPGDEQKPPRPPRRRRCDHLRLASFEITGLQQDARFADVAQPHARILRQAAQKERAHARRQPGQQGQVGFFFDDGGENVRQRAPAKRPRSGQALVQHAAERPDVRAPIHGLAARLLGTHVGRRAENQSLLRHEEAVRFGGRRAFLGRPGANRLGEPEVEDLDDPVGRDADVGRLEVAVHHARLVRRLEPLGDLPAHVDRFVHGQRSARNSSRQVLPRHELEREEANVVLLVDAVDPGDVRMIERGERLGFSFEAPEPLFVVGQLLGQHLDRNFAIEPRIPRSIDLPHPPGSEGIEDLIERKGLTGGEGHAPKSLAFRDPDLLASKACRVP